MMRARVVLPIAAVALALILYWVGRNTEWTEMTVPLPPRGEALTNPFYAAQRLTEALNARAAWDRVFTNPPPDAVMVLSVWNWSLSAPRRQQIERWVESGGRLVIDETVAFSNEEFERWSGIQGRDRNVENRIKTRAMDKERPRCAQAHEDANDRATSDGLYWLCNLDGSSYLDTSKPALWALRVNGQRQVIRVAVGRGTVTVINATPYRYRALFEGDHAQLFVAATGLRRGDDVRFMSEEDHPSLLALTWQYGGPVVVLGLAAVALALWRGAVRFGPPVAAATRARRSLAEQIRGTGHFVARRDGGEALHAAATRALDEAAERRIPGYRRLDQEARTAALANLTGFTADALLAAIHHPRSRRTAELRSTIALLEAARRRTLIHSPARAHGTH